MKYEVESIGENGFSMNFNKHENDFSPENVRKQFEEFTKNMNINRTRVFEDDNNVSIGVILA